MNRQQAQAQQVTIIEPVIEYMQKAPLNGWAIDNYFKEIFYACCDDTNITNIKLTKLELTLLSCIMFKYTDNTKQIEIFTQDLINLNPDKKGLYSIRYKINSENMKNNSIDYINRMYGKNIPTNTLTDAEKEQLENELGYKVMIIER